MINNTNAWYTQGMTQETKYQEFNEGFTHVFRVIVDKVVQMVKGALKSFYPIVPDDTL